MELSQVKRVARMGAKVRGLLKLGGSLGSP
jgi:hypothetical protein